jgi:hypothetical protein
MKIKQLRNGNWKATIDFENSYAKKGTSEIFETRYDAEDWLKSIKKQFGKK